MTFRQAVTSASQASARGPSIPAAVDEDVDAAPRFVHLAEHAGDGVRIGDVRLDGERFATGREDPVHERLRSLRVRDVVDGDLRPCLGQRLDDGCADAGVATRDQRAFDVELDFHGLFRVIQRIRSAAPVAPESPAPVRAGWSDGFFELFAACGIQAAACPSARASPPPPRSGQAGFLRLKRGRGSRTSCNAAW